MAELYLEHVVGDCTGELDGSIGEPEFGARIDKKIHWSLE
jgi:hypothetical protein